MKPYKKFKLFQIRWRESLGDPRHPYLYRWTIVIAGYSLRLHHWIKSDDKRCFHDHPWDFISIPLKGQYKNMTPNGPFYSKCFIAWKAKATDRHYLEIPVGGCWTLLLCGKPYRKWCFWVDGYRRMRPLKYFHKYGVIQTSDYQ